MTTEQWDRIQALYHKLSDLPVAEREGALHADCPDDDLVREEVLELLRTVTTGELDDVVQKVAFDAASLGQDRVGPYRLVKEIGRGGMGTVYFATRDDKEFERKVAIKFLNIGLNRPEYVLRFRQERQILANLEHPHIARLLEGGQTDSGMPYLVMEYVDGKPLFVYCREQRVHRQQVLELVAKICDAVQYAHSQLVVHRDLKPSNILVTEGGAPKLLDFGIAKVLESEGEETQPLTQSTGQLLTLDYASPEQIRGEAVSTVSDVYSLGVILYELLAGGRPFQTKEGGGLLAYRILNEDPLKPSQRARQEGLPAVPAELDNVVMKAMAREPERRYASASALADDLRHFLNGEPVRAHGDSAWYIASKFLRRYRMQSAVAAIFALAVVALAIQLAIANDRLAKERDTAIRERGNARQLSNFMVELFGNAEKQPNPGQEITAGEILDMGARSLRAQPVEDVELRANLFMGIGSAYQRMGRYADARAQLQEAMTLLRGADVSAATARINALTEYANLLERMGELSEAEAVALEAVTVAREHLPSHLPASLSTLGNTLGHQMKYAEAETAYREGIAMNPPVSRHLIPLKGNLAIALYRQGKFEESQQTISEVKALVQVHWKNYPQAMAFVADSTANLEALRGSYRGAVAAFEEMVRILMETNGEDDPMLSHGLCGMAETLLKMNDADAAEQPLAKCASIRAANVKPDSFDALTVLQVQGMLDLQRGNPLLAVEKFRQVRAILESSHGKQHAAQVRALRLLATALSHAGRLEEADQQFREAFTLREQLKLAEDPEYAELMLAAGNAAVRAGKPAAGEAQLRTALRVRQQLQVAPSLLHATEVDLASCLASQGKREEAERLLRSAVSYYQTNSPEIRGEMQRAQTLLAQARVRN